MSASIMLAGLTGHVGLPPMYAEMKTPSAFRPTLYISFSLMFGMCTCTLRSKRGSNLTRHPVVPHQCA